MSVTALHVLSKREFEPIVRIDENVKILAEAPIYGRVVYLEPIQPFVIDLGSISAATPQNWPASGSSKTLDDLELGEREFGQWRLLVLDDYLLEVNLPSTTGRFVRKKGITPISKLSLAKEQLAEIFTYRDIVPKVTPFNPNFDSLDMARLLVAGYRYVFEPLERPPREYTVIPVYGLATTGRS